MQLIFPLLEMNIIQGHWATDFKTFDTNFDKDGDKELVLMYKVSKNHDDEVLCYSCVGGCKDAVIGENCIEKSIEGIAINYELVVSIDLNKTMIRSSNIYNAELKMLQVYQIVQLVTSGISVQ